jgi:hypothetical protein
LSDNWGVRSWTGSDRAGDGNSIGEPWARALG